MESEKDGDGSTRPLRGPSCAPSEGSKDVQRLKEMRIIDLCEGVGVLLLAVSKKWVPRFKALLDVGSSGACHPKGPVTRGVQLLLHHRSDFLSR